ALGTALAWWMYVKEKGEPAERLADAAPGLHQLLYDKWRVDELYEATIIGIVESLADTSAYLDQVLVDGGLARLTTIVVAGSGAVLRAFQNGVIHRYAAMMAVGVAAIGWFFVWPHAKATVVDAGGGDYVVTAAPGVGYHYHWDADGNGDWDTK